MVDFGTATTYDLIGPECTLEALSLIHIFIDDILKNKKRGKKNYIIINAEGIGDS